MIQRDGDIITKVVPDNRRATLMREIGHKVRRGSTIHTDEAHVYEAVPGFGYKHRTVNHSKDEYATKDGRGTQHIDSFFSRLKNSIKGTHVSVSPKHLGKYAGEFEYRHNSRHQPGRMIEELLTVFPKPRDE
jgi:hypothetical protein